MPKTKISEFSSTPANNTDIDSINIAEGCSPSGINDAIRELMAQLKDFQTGAVGDSFNGPVGTTTAAAGAFTTLAASGAVTLSGGTANGVAYLNGSKVVTSGSALTFDGTNLAVTGGSVTAGSTQGNAQLIYGSVYGGIQFRNNTTAQSDVVGDTSGNLFSDFLTSAVWRNSLVGTNELMRLTSTGLGIGTSSPASKLAVVGEARVYTGSNLGYWGVDGGNSYVYFGSNSSGYSLSFQTGGADRMRLDSSGNLGLGVTPSAWSGYKVLQAGIASFAGGSSGAYLIQDNAYTDNSGAGWKYINSGYAAAQYYAAAGAHVWRTAPSGTAGNTISFTQALTLDASGNMLLGTTSGNSRFNLKGPVDTYALATFNQDTATNNAYAQIEFQKVGSVVGSITSLTSGTAYNTTSDYRLKSITGSITTSGAYIDSLNPVEGTWKADGSTFVGLIAHEVQEASRTQVATGTKDGAEMQAMDYSNSELIANLIAEVKSLRQRVATLEAK